MLCSLDSLAKGFHNQSINTDTHGPHLCDSALKTQGNMTARKAEGEEEESEWLHAQRSSRDRFLVFNLPSPGCQILEKPPHPVWLTDNFSFWLYPDWQTLSRSSAGSNLGHKNRISEVNLWENERKSVFEDELKRKHQLHQKRLLKADVSSHVNLGLNLTSHPLNVPHMME